MARLCSLPCLFLLTYCLLLSYCNQAMIEIQARKRAGDREKEEDDEEEEEEEEGNSEDEQRMQREAEDVMRQYEKR